MDSQFKKQKIIETLKAVSPKDIDPNAGKLFAYIYNTGESEVKEIGYEAYKMFQEKNCLDFTVFPSAIFFEKELTKMARGWMRGGDSVVGTFTAGGTESILLAVLAARENYFKSGKQGQPEIVAPETIHPAMAKAAFYLGMKLVKTPLRSDGKADVEKLLSTLSPNTALVALSASNWAYGVVDPISEIAPQVKKQGIPVHVDSCLGGMVLPFFRLNGQSLPDFDFSVDGVTSLSMDFHKYGFTLKGASLVLFQNSEYAKNSIYADVSSPGYVFVNRAILSTRSVGHLAAAWASATWIGEEGYKNFADQTAKAHDTIVEGLGKLGFQKTTPSEKHILVIHHNQIDLVNYILNMKKKGWILHLQKAYPQYNIPLNIHLTISPVHIQVANQFIEDSKQAIEEDSGLSIPKIQSNPQEFMQKLTTGETDSSILPLLIDFIPQDQANEMLKQVVTQWFMP